MLKLRKGGHSDLRKYYGIFEIDFDKRELLPRMSIHKGLIEGTFDILIAYDDESGIDLGYALVFAKNVYRYVLLKYFAVFPWYRDKGVGSEAMDLLAEYYSDRQGMIVEIPEFENNEKEQIDSLHAFFEKKGFREIAADYYIGGAETSIMVKPLGGSAEIEPVYHRIINDFYTRVLPPSSDMIRIKK